MAPAVVHMTLPVNDAGRDFVFGDLHGMTAHLTAAMDRVNFDPSRDRLISVGDLIDRGPDSAGALELLNAPWFYAVRGNHEEMMLEAVRTGDFTQWRAMGGNWATPTDAARWADAVSALPLAITVERPDGRAYGIVHAEYPLDDWDALLDVHPGDRMCDEMIWARRRIRSGVPVRIQNVRFTIHGHTPTTDPLMLGNAIYIDTGCVYGGRLTMLDLDLLPELDQAV